LGYVALTLGWQPIAFVREVQEGGELGIREGRSLVGLDGEKESW
jgi:hypothetical protein